MANNYVEFSEMLSLDGPEEVEWWEIALANPPVDEDGEEVSLPLVLEDADSESPHIWCCWEDTGGQGLEESLELIQQFLQKHPQQNDYWAIQWAFTCSKPRIGEFGGGAAFVTADEICYLSTYEWLQQKIDHHNKSKEAADGGKS